MTAELTHQIYMEIGIILFIDDSHRACECADLAGHLAFSILIKADGILGWTIVGPIKCLIIIKS